MRRRLRTKEKKEERRKEEEEGGRENGLHYIQRSTEKPNRQFLIKFVSNLGFDYIMKEIRKYSSQFKSIFKEVKGKIKTNSKQTKVNT